MKHKTKQSGHNQSMRRLLAEKKKIVIATLLIGVMSMMWGRIFLKKSGPQVSMAAIAAQVATASTAQPKSRITYVQLPYVKGRNDLLSRDMFAGSRWEGFGAEANGAKQHGERAKSGNEKLSDTIETIGKELKLEAISSGKNPQAYVSGTLVSPGGKLIVRHEGEKYEFKAVAMNEIEVVLECKGVRIKLSMARPTDSAN